MVAVAFCASLPRVASAIDELPATQSDAVEKPANVEHAWTRFTSETGRFSVLVPGEPSLLERKTTTIIGTLNEWKYLVPLADGAFSVGFHDLPPIAMLLAPTRVVLSRTRDQILTGTEGTEISFVEYDFDGHPGRILAYEAENSEYRYEEVRMILVGRRLYLLTAGRPALEADRSLMDRFFDSFRIERKSKESNKSKKND